LAVVFKILLDVTTECENIYTKEDQEYYSRYLSSYKNWSAFGEKLGLKLQNQLIVYLTFL
jgi:hypothetical protein